MIEVASKYTPINRQIETLSKQPRFTENSFGSILRFWQGLDTPPPYGDAKRDKFLMDFWKKETLLTGVLHNVILIDANRGWSFTGGRNQVNRFTKMMHEAENGAGWRDYAKKASLFFNATDIGFVNENGREVQDGPLRGLYVTDSTLCKLTGNPDYPLQYNPPGSHRPQKWQPQDFFRVASMPQGEEMYKGLGYCAISRALAFAQLMWAVWEHDREQLGSKMMKGVLVINNITESQWQKAMESRDEQLSAKQRDVYGGVEVLTGVGEYGSVDAKLVALSNLPAGFDQERMTNMLMYGYALCFGYDPREFWPVSSGPLGTGKETEIQDEKASRKGGADFMLSYQEQLQMELPETIHFEFEERDVSGDILNAQMMQAKADVINSLQDISPDERRQLYAQEGLIPEEWTIQDEEVTATDEESLRQRLLNLPSVRRACEKYQNEPIVRYSVQYKGGMLKETEKVLWPSGKQALEPAVWYIGKNVKITQRDISNARQMQQVRQVI